MACHLECCPEQGLMQRVSLSAEAWPAQQAETQKWSYSEATARLASPPAAPCMKWTTIPLLLSGVIRGAPLCLMQVQIYMQRGHGSLGEREGLKSVLVPVRNTHGDIAQAAGGAANGALRIQLRRLRGQRLRQSVTGRAHGGVRPLRWRFLQQQMQPTSDSSLLHSDGCLRGRCLRQRGAGGAHGEVRPLL